MALSRDKIETLVGDWTDLLIPFMSSPKMDTVFEVLKKEKAEGVKILPEQKNIFRAFQETPLSTVRLIVIGQDPYPSPEHACGIAFSIPPGVALPRSLEKIYYAIEQDVYAGLDLKGDPENRKGDLRYLCSQGVLFLNAALTIGAKSEKNPSGVSHQELWQSFINYTVSSLQSVKRSLIWMAWGAKAQEFVNREVNQFQNNHFVLLAEHPVKAAYEKRDWEHNNHFSRANAIIIANHLGEPVKW
jgi:uracil-DNA glycosylase